MNDMVAVGEEVIVRKTAVAVGILALNMAIKHRQRLKRRVWYHSWLQKRAASGFFNRPYNFERATGNRQHEICELPQNGR